MTLGPAARIQSASIAAAYSADTIALHGRVTRPFAFQGKLWACTNLSGHGEAYRLVPIEQFDGTPITYTEKTRHGETARNDPQGFYHGIKVQYRKDWFVLGGPPVRFPPAPAVKAETTTKMQQMQLFAEPE